MAFELGSINNSSLHMSTLLIVHLIVDLSLTKTYVLRRHVILKCLFDLLAFLLFFVRMLLFLFHHLFLLLLLSF
jgi:hypothetical protein